MGRVRKEISVGKRSILGHQPPCARGGNRVFLNGRSLRAAEAEGRDCGLRWVIIHCLAKHENVGCDPQQETETERETL